jgi:hypothetical protein
MMASEISDEDERRYEEMILIASNEVENLLGITYDE